jgi:DNA-directed RNA polymerase specialized sigma24 family protein
MERLELTDDDVARIERLAAAQSAAMLVDGLAPDQRDAVVAHVVHEHSYEQIAGALGMSQAVVRKRVSRGLQTVRQRMGGRG